MFYFIFLKYKMLVKNDSFYLNLINDTFKKCDEVLCADIINHNIDFNKNDT